jgi:hypothetical protein
MLLCKCFCCHATHLYPSILLHRIFYINGFKQVRSLLAEHVHPAQYEYANTVRLAAALVPGIAMTPVSSLLEACNAGHMNAEPLYRRWTRCVL